MLDEEKIKEIEKKIKGYLEDNLIWKYKEFKDEILETYKRNYKESLDIAEKLFNQNLSNLWVVVISYYSMFYIVNAVLYKIGYKIEHKIAHKVTSDALIVYIRNKLKKSLLEDYEEAKEEALELAGLKTDELLQSFDYERMKRSEFQYETTEEIKRAKALTSLDRAKKFIFEMKKLLK